jgi:GDP-D-mannose dehydratase
MDEKRIKIYLDNCCYNRPFDEQNQDLIDYTEWQRTLWNDLTIDEVYKLAADNEKRRENSGTPS